MNAIGWSSYSNASLSRRPATISTDKSPKYELARKRSRPAPYTELVPTNCSMYWQLRKPPDLARSYVKWHPNVTLRCSNAASPAVAVLDLPCVGKLTTFGSRTHHVRFVETLIAVVHATLSTNSISCFLSSCNKLVVFVLTAMMMELYASIEWKWLDGNGTHKQLYIDADFSFYILNQLYIDLFLSWLIYIFLTESRIKPPPIWSLPSEKNKSFMLQ